MANQHPPYPRAQRLLPMNISWRVTISVHPLLFLVSERSLIVV
jgi:hypothetical protein